MSHHILNPLGSEAMEDCTKELRAPDEFAKHVLRLPRHFQRRVRLVLRNPPRERRICMTGLPRAPDVIPSKLPTSCHAKVERALPLTEVTDWEETAEYGICLPRWVVFDAERSCILNHLSEITPHSFKG